MNARWALVSRSRPLSRGSGRLCETRWAQGRHIFECFKEQQKHVKKLKLHLAMKGSFPVTGAAYANLT